MGNSLNFQIKGHDEEKNQFLFYSILSSFKYLAIHDQNVRRLGPYAVQGCK